MRGGYINRPARLILVGLRGAGKTAAGRYLAELTGTGFVDTDDLVEAQAGISIAEIFAREGESGFRQREDRALAGLGSRPVPEVVATGGGIVLAEPNRKSLRNVGLVVYLRAPPRILARRIGSAVDRINRRPSLTGLDPAQEMETLARQREPLYLQVAHVVVDCTGPLVEVVHRLSLIWKSLQDHNAPGIDQPQKDA